MLSIFYEIVLYFFALMTFPKILYQRIKHGKYKQSFWKRLGLGLPPFKKKKGGLVIWMHAVSVGETKAIVPLAHLIKETYANATLVISSGTETGYAEAKRILSFADSHLFFPFDFRWSVKRVLKLIQPNVIILCETDYWYNFTRLAKKMGANIIVVNAKISFKSMRRFQRISYLSQRLFSLFDYICVQNILYCSRFEKLGVAPAHLKATGNLKFDETVTYLSESELHLFKNKLGIEKQDLFLVIGSTHAPEEEWLIPIIHSLWRKFPRLKVLMAPRHPERFSEVSQLLSEHHIPHTRFSELKNGAKTVKSFILMDAMGQLRKCYQSADVAIVAGSFVDHVGGHNILEPCSYATPVIFGPFMQSQPDFVELALAYGSGLQVSILNLEKTLIDLFQENEKRKEIGWKGLKLIQENKGAAQKSFNAIRPFLELEETSVV